MSGELTVKRRPIGLMISSCGLFVLASGMGTLWGNWPLMLFLAWISGLVWGYATRWLGERPSTHDAVS